MEEEVLTDRRDGSPSWVSRDPGTMESYPRPDRWGRAVPVPGAPWVSVNVFAGHGAFRRLPNALDD